MSTASLLKARDRIRMFARLAVEGFGGRFDTALSHSHPSWEGIQLMSTSRVTATVRIASIALFAGLIGAPTHASTSFSSIFSFDTPDGNISSALVQGADGNFYGTASTGGPSSGYGSVFKIASDGTRTLLHVFTGSDGSQPDGTLAFGSDGALYGTTTYGGSSNHGTVYKITTDGAFTSLY